MPSVVYHPFVHQEQRGGLAGSDVVDVDVWCWRSDESLIDANVSFLGLKFLYYGSSEYNGQFISPLMQLWLLLFLLTLSCGSYMLRPVVWHWKADRNISSPFDMQCNTKARDYKKCITEPSSPAL